MIDNTTRQAIADAFAENDLDGTRHLLEAARAAHPEDADVLVGLGHVLRRQGQLGDALRAFDAALGLDQFRVDAWLERAWAFEAGGSLERADESYRAAAVCDPESVAALAGSAGIAARARDFGRARDLAVAALAITPDHPGAILALSRAHIEGGDAQQAIGTVRALAARPGLDADTRIAALSLLGDALDRGRETTEAYAAYAAAKAEFAARHLTPPGEHRAFIDRVSADFESIDPAIWFHPPAPANDVPVVQHIFLIGYPRSGTTLVENILATAPGVVAIEERPTLREADAAFLDTSDGLARLAALDATDLAWFRAAYWSRVASVADIVGKTLIDMDPLKGIRLPIIAQLFPDARILVMRRDPRDVVWSCFRTLLAPTPAAFDMTDLTAAANHYGAVMRLTDASLARLPLASLDVRYDALVSDFDTTTQAICAFTGIAWSEDLRRFERTAAERGVTTASMGQVQRGLYDGGGQWRRYADQMEHVAALLKPWVVRYGAGD